MTTLKPTTHAKAPAMPAYKAKPAAWPRSATGSATVPPPSAGQKSGVRTAIPSTPVWVRSVRTPSHSAARTTGDQPRKVSVHVLDHKAATAAGVSGVLFTVGRASSSQSAVTVGLDYATFAHAYGGNYGDRLSLVELPPCALTTPEQARCRKQTPLATHHDAAGKTVSATVTLSAPEAWSAAATASGASAPALVLAADTADVPDSGPGGTYAADSLKPSGSWTADDSNGSFTYDYPITMPSASSPLAPSVDLAYDSGSVDGQTASTQAQASWVGDGWATPDSYIERTFTACSDSPEGSASPVSTSDQCYAGNVLTLSLNGKSTALVTSDGTTFTAADDSGEKIEHVLNSANGSGTYNTDYWKVTDRDGTTYAFGENHLPGWTTGKPATNSVDYEPVYSAHSDDPCYSSTGFTSSACTMAYRWHLDYVADAHGNAASYYYKQDTNYYGQDKGAKNSAYIRDSHLDHIDYGFRDNGAYGTVPDKVVFHSVARCVESTCDPLSASNAASQYPDVPYDLNCAAGATCSAWSPSFYSTVRLDSISTEQYLAGAPGSYQTVDSYQLAQSTPATGDGTSPTLWLDSITHEGDDTTAGGSSTAISMPKVTFTGTDLQNRVDTSQFPALYRWRISTITSELGGVTSVSYENPDPCTAAYVASASPASNTKSCYPVYWTPKDYTAPTRDWFEKYAVTQVLETDDSGGSEVKSTDYTYTGGAAWHFDDNEVVKAKYRTYGQFRGFATVETRGGDGTNEPQTLAVSTYYRGMGGTLTDSQGGTHADSDQLAGQVLEETAYKGDGGPVDHSTINSYWVSPAMATRNRSALSLPALTANFVQPVETFSRQALTDGGTTTWRYTETDSSYDTTASSDTYGVLLHTYRHTVPVNAAYDACTTNSYAPANSTKNLVGLVALQETDSVACGGFTEGSTPSAPSGANTLTAPASVDRPARVQSAIETFYDDPAFSTTFPQTAAPSAGDVTMTREASDYAGGAFTWQTTKRQTFDTYGRPLDVYDANGNKTSTSYTVDAAGLTTAQTATNAKSQQTSTTYDPTRGLAISVTDINGIHTTSTYDALGRPVAVWKYSRATTTPANTTYAYTLPSPGSPISGVATSTLNDSLGYVTRYTLFDALGRVRQTQAPTPQGGRLITESFYDSRGMVRKKNNAYWDPNTTPTLAFASVQDSAIPSQDVYTYDGLGRIVTDESQKYSVTQETTTTVYNGDTTTVIPPDGGVVKATVTDPLGRTTALKEYTSPPTVTKPANTFTGTWYTTGGTTSDTTYGYDARGKQNTVSHAGDTWTTVYNLLGRKTSATDPDAGTSTYLYDADGNLTQSTDSRGKSVSTTYDVLNRKTAQYAATLAAQSPSNELASWVYDNDNDARSVLNPNGQVTTATSYDADGNAYAEQALGFNVFGESFGEIITIPAAQGALGRSYQFKHVYTSNSGLLYSDGYPLGGGLPSESVTHGYATAFDLPNALADTSYGYAQGTTYDAFSRPVQEVVGASGANQASISYSYDVHTGALTDQLVSRTTATPARVDEEAYSYDEAGNPVRETSTRLGSSTTAETQCYRYDGLDRLTTAWTATDDCTATPSATDSSTVGDPLATASAYWTGWTFTPAGQRGTQIQHATATGGTDTLTTYTHDGNGSDQAHTLTGDTTTGATTGSDTYSYDAAGNMTARDTAATGNQTLTWNDAGQLTKITAGTTQVGYVYDADGNLLIKTDPTSKTLYLPGEQITLNTTTGTTSGVRYLPLPGGGTAVRTGTGSAYSFEIADPHGTTTLYLDSTAQTPTWRQFTPYGAPRGTTTTWLDDRGFLNKPTDTTTGLTTIGAREYDPTTGAFISLDPVFEPNDPQQLNGYDYAGDNPVTSSDPDGKMIKDDLTGYSFGNAKGMRDWYEDEGYTHHGHATTKLNVLLGNDNRSWWRYYHSDRYIAAVDKYNHDEAMRLKLQNQEGRRPLPELNKATNKMLDEIAGKNMCDNSYAQASGACGPSGYGPNNSGNPLIGVDDDGDIFQYASGGISYCFIVCASLSGGADGHAYITVGAVGFGGYGHFGAAASAKSNDQSWFSAGVCASVGFGACIQAGTRQHSDIPKYSSRQAGNGDWWFGGSFAPGEGAFAGINFTYEIH